MAGLRVIEFAFFLWPLGLPFIVTVALIERYLEGRWCGPYTKGMLIVMTGATLSLGCVLGVLGVVSGEL